ncbi:prepilin-type N-terminal cleavage/methylation domain-containing protein [uncultured Gimesia sp.]|uniref:type II secretion system protein n=1 Tax=uncultured Gimesia sp. TaxID=1678688 RepID=UPI0030DAC82D|tara:strand:+ start:95377 stop:95808 length:432 start_codon:yes stop_codon:yes gene_type:complete
MRTASSADRAQRRHGFTLVEMMVAGVLLMTVTMIVVPAIYWVHRERRQIEYRQIAIVEVENMMERVVALPFHDINQTKVDKFVFSESALRQLPNADLNIEISESSGLPLMKKIQVQLGWNDHRGINVVPVRLTSWVCLKEKHE